MFNTIDEAVLALKNGEMIVVIDDENRENEGDLIMAGETVTGEAMNFIATYGKGLICTPIDEETAQRLQLEQMVSKNTDNHSTAFTVAIDHNDTTTGISAFERAFTIRKMCEDNAKPEDFRRPGHIFPLTARKGGVLVRRGHTEATVDLVKLAGFKGIGICCEIIDDDGHMMRTTKLIEFAKKNNLKIITIDALVNYMYTKLYPIEKVAEASLPTEYGIFKMTGYYDNVTGKEHVALTMGELKENDPTLLRVHSECLTGDVFGSLKCDCGNQLKEALKRISNEKKGALIYMRQEGRGIGLLNKIKAYSLQEQGMDTVEANIALGFPEDMRSYNSTAQIIKMLGLNKIKLMTNNPDKIQGLESCGIEITERIPIEVKHGHEADFYMKTKRIKMNHILKND